MKEVFVTAGGIDSFTEIPVKTHGQMILFAISATLFKFFWKDLVEMANEARLAQVNS